MVWRCRRGIVVLVTAVTIVAHPIELQGVTCSVAVRTGQVTVRTNKCESVLLMQIRYVVHDPIHGCVTASAIIANACGMNVSMAGRTGHGCCIEDQSSMARLAIHLRMGSFQRKIR